MATLKYDQSRKDSQFVWQNFGFILSSPTDHLTTPQIFLVTFGGVRPLGWEPLDLTILPHTEYVKPASVLTI